jgi:membrane-associated phospholipid phosphatase
VTWHAISHLLVQSLTLALGALALFLVWAVPHRGKHWLRSSSRSAREKTALGEWLKSHPDLDGFLRRHFDHDNRSWPRLLIGTAATLIFAFLFVHLVRAVLTDPKLEGADIRMHNTLRLFESETLHRRFSAVTRLASPPFIIPLVIALIAILAGFGRRREAAAFGAAALLQGIAAVGLKYLIRRPRPPDAIPLHLGPSFPSGHTLAATVIYGFVAYLLMRDFRERWWRALLAVALLVLILLVPLSRVYLGVHWPFDTVASLDLGAALLAIVITLFKYPPFERMLPDLSETMTRRTRMALGGLSVVAAAAGGIFATAQIEPETRPRLPPMVTAIRLDELRQYPRTLGQRSEDLIGGPMEPVSFLFVGDALQLRSAFERAGWSLADTPSATGLSRELLAVIRDAPDPHGPATPAYFDAQPQDFTFERAATPSGSIRRRHHIRVWRTAFHTDARTPIWAATCSYDEGIEIVAKPYVLTHRIDPQVDRERELIDAQLRAAGVSELAFVVVTGPRRGRNAGGDPFFTDGRAHVLVFERASQNSRAGQCVRAAGLRSAGSPYQRPCVGAPDSAADSSATWHQFNQYSPYQSVLATSLVCASRATA